MSALGMATPTEQPTFAAAPSPELPLRIRVLRRLNPMLLALLASPLHGVLSRRLLALTYRGRKSGKPYTIPLAYVEQAGQPYLFTREHTAWWKSAIAADDVTLVWRGRRVRGTAVRCAATDPDAETAFARFLAAFPGTAKMLYQVEVDTHGRPDPAAMARELPHSVVVRIDLSE